MADGGGGEFPPPMNPADERPRTQHGLLVGDTMVARMANQAQRKRSSFEDIWQRVAEGLSRREPPRETISLQGMDATCTVHSVNNAITERVNVSKEPQGQVPLIQFDNEEPYLNSQELAKTKVLGMPSSPSGFSEGRTREGGLPMTFISQILNQLRVVQRSFYFNIPEGVDPNTPTLLMRMVTDHLYPSGRQVGVILGFVENQSSHAIAMRFMRGPSLSSSRLRLQDSHREWALEIPLSDDPVMMWYNLNNGWRTQTHQWGWSRQSRIHTIFLLEDVIRDENVNPALQEDMMDLSGNAVYPPTFGRDLGRAQIGGRSPYRQFPNQGLQLRVAEQARMEAARERAGRQAEARERAARRLEEESMDDADREVRAIMGSE